MDCRELLTLVSLLVLSATTVNAKAQAPIANIPVSSLSVTLDGVVQDAEWADAAVLRNIYKYGGVEIANPLTAVYLKYAEAENELLVGVRCFENETGYPKANQRKPTDYFGDDDAVQIVLGTADSNIVRTSINFGGYVNALGTASSRADYYYQFTVNAVGAMSRTYNEGILDRPLFKAVVASHKGEWDVEMRIPLMSAGIKNLSDKTVYFNMFRFRPPDMTAWYIPAFGGYSLCPSGPAS